MTIRCGGQRLAEEAWLEVQSSTMEADAQTLRAHNVGRSWAGVED